MHISHLGDSTGLYLINLLVVLAPRRPHLRSDTSQLKTPYVSDPEKIIHKIVWKERKSVRAENPEYSVEDYPPSSSQEVRTENPEFYSETPRRGSAWIEEESHPAFEAEEIKEVTEVVAVNRELFPSTPQASCNIFPLLFILHFLLLLSLHLYLRLLCNPHLLQWPMFLLFY